MPSKLAGGLRAVAYAGFQLREGEPRRDMVVIEIPVGAGCVRLWLDA